MNIFFSILYAFVFVSATRVFLDGPQDALAYVLYLLTFALCLLGIYRMGPSR